MAPASFSPSKKPKEYWGGDPAPPLATEMNVMVAPGAVSVRDGVAVTTRSAMVTIMEVDALPPASSPAVTETAYCPAAVYECVAGVPSPETSSPNFQA